MKKTVCSILFVLALLVVGSMAAASTMWTTTNVKPVITLRYKDSLGRNVASTFTLPGIFEMDQDTDRNLYVRLLAFNNDRTMVIAAQAIGMGIPQAGGGINAVLCTEDQLNPQTLNFGTDLAITAPEALIMDGTYNVDISNKCSGNITLTAVGTIDASGFQTPARMTASFHLPVMTAQAALSNFSSITRDLVPPPASPTLPTATDISGNMAFGTTTTINLLKGAQSFQTNSALTAFIDSNPVNGHLSTVAPGAVPNGKVTYSPNAGFAGNDIFTYHVTDSALLNSNPHQATISVGGQPNTTPVLLKVEKNTASPGTKIDFSSLNLGKNNFVTSVTPGLGTITQVGNVFSYTPAPGFTGFDTLTYTLANNTTSWTATGEVDVEVTPIAVNYVKSLAGTNSAQIDVLTNDIPFNAGDTLTVTSFSQGTYGTVSVSNGVVTYLLNPGGLPGVAEDHFTYTVTESNNLQTSTGVVTILLQ